jgi:hypothetical protein
MLAERVQAAGAAAEAKAGKPIEHVPVPRPAPKAPRAPKAPSKEGVGDFLQSRQGKALQREVVRGIFGMLRKRL